MISTATKVPHLPPLFIEQKTEELLEGFGAKYGRIVIPPVPIDAIVELHLQLTFNFLDLCEMFGADNIHGALWVDRREVGIDQSLDPELHPELEGRYHFTLAHEVGHWILHRNLASSPQLDSDAYVCHNGHRRPRIERQADYFAACLLMPRRMVRVAWSHDFGWEPLDVQAMREASGLPDVGDDLKSLREYLESICARLACFFCVSPMAMRIRLEELGLFVHPKLQGVT